MKTYIESNREGDWHQLVVEGVGDDRDTFGFSDVQGAKNAIRFAIFCQENDITLEELNKALI